MSGKLGSLLAAMLGVGWLVACDGADLIPPEALLHDGEILFIVQSEEPTAFMDALFQGNLVADSLGCLRLQRPDGGLSSTVVWRPGFSLEGTDGSYQVRGPDGGGVADVGGEITMGGGHVPDLHDGIPLEESMRVAARERCPGSYWLVGGLP